jgi:GNAT superfamily N-acetyltransferase
MRRVFILNDLFVAESLGVSRWPAGCSPELEAYAWSFGASRITLNVERSNTRAQSLYEACGWKQDDRYFMVHRYPPPGQRGA